MKQKVVVKIFLPNAPSLEPAETEYLCGEIKCEYENERGCRQILIFITSRRQDRPNCTFESRQCIGEISANRTKCDQSHVDKDYVWLEYDPSASDAIRLKNICLPVSAPDPECQLKVQIILYEPQTFCELSKDDEELQPSTAAMDPITHLIKLLRHSELPDKSSQVRCGRFQQFLWLILMTINRILLCKSLRINESAFLRHFSIWLNSIKLFTFKRFVNSLPFTFAAFNGCKNVVLNFTCSGRAWTIVFDVTFGMILMLILLRVSDPGEYLMKFTKVSRCIDESGVSN